MEPMFLPGVGAVTPGLRELIAGIPRAPQNGGSGASVQQAIQSRPFWILVLVLFLCLVGQIDVITQLSALLTDRGVSSHEAAIAVSLVGAASRLVTRCFLRTAAGLLPEITLSALCIFVLSEAMGPLAAIPIGIGDEAILCVLR